MSDFNDAYSQNQKIYQVKYENLVLNVDQEDKNNICENNNQVLNLKKGLFEFSVGTSEQYIVVDKISIDFRQFQYNEHKIKKYLKQIQEEIKEHEKEFKNKETKGSKKDDGDLIERLCKLKVQVLIK